MPDFTSVKVYVVNFMNNEAPLYFESRKDRDHYAASYKWGKVWKTEMEICLPHLVKIIERGDFIAA